MTFKRKGTEMKKTTLTSTIISLVALAATGVRAETYYHKGADGWEQSSFNVARVSNSVGWSTSPNGSVVSSIADWAGSDFIVSGSGNSIRLPATDSDITFAGKSLTVSDSTISFKRATSTKTALTRNVTIADLRFTGPGGVLDHGESKGDHGGSVATIFCVKGGISIADNAAMTLGQSFNSSNDQREFVIDSAVTGGEASAIAFRTSCSSSINNVSAVATFNLLTGFYGTFKVDSATTTPNLYLTVNGTFNGTVTSRFRRSPRREGHQDKGHQSRRCGDKVAPPFINGEFHYAGACRRHVRGRFLRRRCREHRLEHPVFNVPGRHVQSTAAQGAGERRRNGLACDYDEHLLQNRVRQRV